MGGQWKHRREAAAHKRAREAMLRTVIPGQTPCYRCTHPLEPGDLIELDHADDGSYGGFSHGRSPCRVCGKRCNPSAGGTKGALLQGKKPRLRRCGVCGKAFTASRSSDGASAVTCGAQPCIAALRASRRAHEPDPQAPPASGRPW